MGHEDLGAIHEDVVFDEPGARRLIAECNAAANAIEAQLTKRRTLGEHADDGWEGFANQHLWPRVNIGIADAKQLVTAYRKAAEEFPKLITAAGEEQARRIKARAYVKALKENEENESMWNKIGDWWSGEDFEPPPKPDPPINPPSIELPPPETARA